MQLRGTRTGDGRRESGASFPAFAAAMGLIAGVALTGLAVPYVRSERVTTQVSADGTATAGVVDPVTGEIVTDAQGAPVVGPSSEVGTGTGSVEAGGAAGPTEAVGGATDKGVTADRIKLGIGIIDVGAAKDLGFNFDIGDEHARYEALIADQNAKGGIHGRKIVADYRTFDATNPASPAQAACVSWTKDVQVFSVIVESQFPAAAAVCVFGQNQTPFITTDGIDESYYANGLYFSTQANDNRILEDHARYLHGKGVMKGKTIGVLGGDGTERAAIDRTLVPVLAELGYEVADIETVPATTQGTQQMPIAISNFKAKGIDFVIIAANVILAGPFVQASDRAGFHPAFALVGLQQRDQRPGGLVLPGRVRGDGRAQHPPVPRVPRGRQARPGGPVLHRPGAEGGPQGAPDDQLRVRGGDGGVRHVRRVGQGRRAGGTQPHPGVVGGGDGGERHLRHLLDPGRDLRARQARRGRLRTGGGLAQVVQVLADRGRALRSGATDGVVTALLQVEGMDVSYGHVQVLFDISLEVREGETLALLGTNGAGKSTLLRAITGLLPADRGTVTFAGEELDGLPTDERVARGIVQVHGGSAVFPSLSVRDNLRLGAFAFLKDKARVARRMDHVLAIFPVLAERLEQSAGSMSGGEQQMIALAKALLPEPRLLVIDELSLGLAPIMVERLLGVIQDLKTAGLTMLVVEQSLNCALAFADRAVFMEKGEIQFSGDPHELMADGDLVHAVFFGAGSVR